MAFNQHNWKTGELITEGEMNRIENGISSAINTAEGMSNNPGESLNITIDGEQLSMESPGAGYILVTLDKDEICDFYAITNTGEPVLASGYGCSSFIDCYGSPYMMISKIKGPSASSYGIAFYDVDKEFIANSFIAFEDATTKERIFEKIEIPEGAAYFKTSYFDYATSQTIGEFKCFIYIKETLYGYRKYRPYQNGYIFYSQAINQSITKYWTTNAETYAVDQNFKSTTGVLTLPESYTPTGKQTKLIMYCHGWSHYVYYSGDATKGIIESNDGTGLGWGSTNAFRKQKKNWTDMGFAVMDVNGARNNNRNAQFQTGMCPQGISALRQCVKYITDHYNIDPKIYIVCGSAGGSSGWNYIRFYPEEVRAMVAIATWCKLSVNSWDAQKSVYTEYLGFNSTSTYETEKAKGFDPYEDIVTINDIPYIFTITTPIYFIYGSKDTGSFVTTSKDMITALRNAGRPVQQRVFTGLEHSETVSGGNIYVDTEIGNWLLMH